MIVEKMFLCLSIERKSSLKEKIKNKVLSIFLKPKNVKDISTISNFFATFDLKLEDLNIALPDLVSDAEVKIFVESISTGNNQVSLILVLLELKIQLILFQYFVFLNMH